MIVSISKNKIPRNHSFVVKTHQIEIMLIDNNIETDVDLRYGQMHLNGDIFSADYYFPGDRGYLKGIYINADAVLKDKAYIARTHIREKVIPEFVKWIKETEKIDATNVLYHQQPFFRANFNGDEVSISTGYR